MGIALNAIFNSSGDVGQWLTASSTNVTGSLFISILLIIGFFLLLMMLFKMPEIFMALILFPFLIIVSVIDGIGTEIKIIIGICVLVVGLGLYAFYPSK
jgi:uncharacterized membrane protein YjjP (DUF1212 family)